MRSYLCLFFILGVTTLINAQEIDVVNTNSAKESLRVAQDLIAQNEFKKAKKQLEHTVKIKENFAIAYRLLGKVCLDMADYDCASHAFETSFDLDDKLSRAAFFECGEAHLNNEKPDLALYYYERYEQNKGKRYANASKESALEIEYDNLLATRKANCSYILQLDTANIQTWAKHLGRSVNSKHDEYLPSITSDGKHLLFTRNIRKLNENIFLSSLTKENYWQDAMPIDGKLNTANNEGMAKFEAHGNTFYFAGCKREDEESGCDIYKATFDDGKVTAINSIEGNLNSYYWDSQPSISCDGQTMYFSSTRLDGFGGADIWKSQLMANGEWGVPENLGPHINTPQDEQAPFIGTDGVSLYFTSDGHLGQGNGDIFVSWWENEAWSIPENMGFPINSPAKELGFYIKGDGKTAYFASSRKNGRGGLDLYEVEVPQLLRPSPMVQLEVFVVDELTQEPISCNITLGNNGTNHAYTTNENGWVFTCLDGNKGYSFQIKHKGYAPLIDAVFLDAQDNSSNQQVRLELKSSTTKEEVVEEKVEEEPDKHNGEERLTKTIVQLFFETNSYELNEKNVNKLAYVIELLERYDDWSVEVVGFADNQGDAKYNKELSQKRAQKIVDFLNEQSSIAIQTNVNAIGKGATGVANDEQSRKKSRRVDVILTR